MSDLNEKEVNSNLECALLTDCPSIVSLLSAMIADQLAQKTTIELFGFLRKLNCGYQGSEALIFCPPM